MESEARNASVLGLFKVWIDVNMAVTQYTRVTRDPNPWARRPDDEPVDVPYMTRFHVGLLQGVNLTRLVIAS